MTLDHLFLKARLAGYTIGQLSQTPRGWDIILWSGPIGYSTYATPAYSPSPHTALLTAIDILDRGEGHTLACNVVTSEPAASNLREILDRLKPSQPATHRRPWAS